MADNLADLIEVALGDKIMHTNGSGDRIRAYAAHVALVVEQHTNERIARLREHVEELAARGLPADLNPTVLGKADYVWWSNYLHRIDQTVRSNARAALEGEQQ